MRAHILVDMPRPVGCAVGVSIKQSHDQPYRNDEIVLELRPALDIRAAHVVKVNGTTYRWSDARHGVENAN